MSQEVKSVVQTARVDDHQQAFPKPTKTIIQSEVSPRSV